jgi:hypothetical protein
MPTLLSSIKLPPVCCERINVGDCLLPGATMRHCGNSLTRGRSPGQGHSAAKDPNMQVVGVRVRRFRQRTSDRHDAVPESPLMRVQNFGMRARFV